MGGRADRSREPIRKLEDRLSQAFGTIAAAIGLLLVGVDGRSQSYAVPAGGIGLVFGALGHLLGAHWLGGAIVVVSVAEIVTGLLT